MQRAGIPAILIFEDMTWRTPYRGTDQDTVGRSVNSEELVRKNVQTALGTIATLARPARPPEIVLRASRLPGDPELTVRLSWTGGFPAFDLHRGDAAVVADLRNDANVYQPALALRTAVDAQAAGDLLFYCVEESP